MAWLKQAVAYSGSECLPWPFSRNNYGYGVVFCNGKTTLAHRVVCGLADGPAPSPQHDAAHSCGNGHLGCCNPVHLRWATRKDNIADMIRHGTILRGEKSNSAKLNRKQVLAIRAAEGTRRDVAARFGVSQSTVSRIKLRNNWGWL